MKTKQLPRLTVCEYFEIKQPRWKKPVSIGLAVDRLKEHNLIKITYRRKWDNELSYPGEYYISLEDIKAQDYELDTRYGRGLVIIPIQDLSTLERI